MDNMYEPTGGDPKDVSHPTEQFWPMSRGPGGGHGPGYQNPGYQGSGYQDSRYQDPRYQNPRGGPGHDPRRRNPLHWTVGLVAAAALAIGGIAAGVSLAGHSSPAVSTSAAAPGTQAAALNTALNSADAPGTLAVTSSSSRAGTAGAGAGAAGAGAAGTAAAAHPCGKALKAARAARKAGHPAAARAARKAAGARCLGLRRRIARVALLRGIDGQFTFRGKGGTPKTVAFERGVVQSFSGTTVVVQATDGTTWSWDLVSNSVVRENGAKTSKSALATGEPVWVGGPVESGIKDARLVVIRPPSGSSSSSSPSPSPSSSSAAGS